MDDFSTFISSAPGLLTWSGLALLNVIALLRGWIIPKATHIRELKILQDRITDVTEERNEWRDTARTFENVSREAQAQAKTLLDDGKTTTYALDQIRESLRLVGKEGK
jgi:hypothetical protein